MRRIKMTVNKKGKIGRRMRWKGKEDKGFGARKLGSGHPSSVSLLYLGSRQKNGWNDSIIWKILNTNLSCKIKVCMKSVFLYLVIFISTFARKYDECLWNKHMPIWNSKNEQITRVCLYGKQDNDSNEWTTVHWKLL
jgi:hypothetical protein